MRSFLLVVLGALAGIVGTVMFLSVNTTLESGGDDGPGGGNVRVTLDETALETILVSRFREIEESGADTTVSVTVNSNGLIDVAVGVGVAPAGVVTELVLDPEVMEGQLIIEVVDARVGGLATPDELSEVVEEVLREQLADAARGLEYRLTAITTTEAQLTLEIEI